MHPILNKRENHWEKERKEVKKKKNDRHVNSIVQQKALCKNFAN